MDIFDEVDEEQFLSDEERKIYAAYLNCFTSDAGKIVLEDIKKSFFDRATPDDQLQHHWACVKREAERGVYRKIVSVMQIAAADIQRREGVEPRSHAPEVITEDEETI